MHCSCTRPTLVHMQLCMSESKSCGCRYVVLSLASVLSVKRRWLPGLECSYLGRLLGIPIWDKVEVYVWCEVAPQQGSKDLGAELCAKWAQSLLKELNKHRLLHISGTHG